MLAATLFDAPRNDVCFAFSTKDRVPYTLESISTIGFESGFDLLWLDGSATEEGRQLPALLAPNLPALREIHSAVVGGPDMAILTALTRMLTLGYRYCGLIENDVRFQPGWFAALMAVFERGAADGLAMGAATARGLTKRVLYWRNGYAVTMLSGAGMILFRRDAAELILRNYRTTTSTEITDWFLQLSGKDHREIGESGTGAGAADTRIASDMIYELVLQKHGLAIGATVPALAKNLDAEHLVFRDVGGYCSTETAVRSNTDDVSFARFVQRLADYRPEHARDRQPYLHFGSLHCWMIFLHQILFVPDAEAALRGRWKIVWEKFNGPFGYDALEPGASLSFPLHGELKGIFCSRTPDGGIVEVYQGDRLIGDFDSYADTPTRDQYFAGFNLAADGAGPITFRLSARRNPASSGSTFRISSLCFSTAQPWLPNVGSFTADAFVALLERQAETGGLSF